MYNETISQYYIYVFGGDLAVSAQDRTVENRPYTDLRPLHFGVLVGTHVQDVPWKWAWDAISTCLSSSCDQSLSLFMLLATRSIQSIRRRFATRTF